MEMEKAGLSSTQVHFIYQLILTEVFSIADS